MAGIGQMRVNLRVRARFFPHTAWHRAERAVYPQLPSIRFGLRLGSAKVALWDTDTRLERTIHMQEVVHLVAVALPVYSHAYCLGGHRGRIRGKESLSS